MDLFKTKSLTFSVNFNHKWNKNDWYTRHEFKRKKLGIEWTKYKVVGSGKNPFSFYFIFNLIWVNFWFTIKWKAKTFKIDE